MSYIKSNPNAQQLIDQSELLYNYEQAIQQNNGSKSISYNAENNMYEYSPNLGTDTIVSLYSTDDILYHYFGDDLQNAVDNGDVFVISTNSGYDIISYKGQLLAYGATANIADHNSFWGDVEGKFGDTAKLYGGQLVGNNLGAVGEIAYKFSWYTDSTGKLVDNAGSETSYKAGMWTKYFISLLGFDSPTIKIDNGAWSKPDLDNMHKYGGGLVTGIKAVLNDYVNCIISESDISYLKKLEIQLINNSRATIEPDMFSSSMTGYDEYFEKHSDSDLLYNGSELKITTDEMIELRWKIALENEQNYQQWVSDNNLEDMAETSDDVCRLLYNKYCSFGNSWVGEKFYEIKDFFVTIIKCGKDYVVDLFNSLFPDNTSPEDISSNAGIKRFEKIVNIMESSSSFDFKSELFGKMAFVKSKVNTAATARVYCDPIMLDLDGDGFNIETKENGTHFDLDNNGFAEKINWTRKDGFLCLDLNGNGVIDNGGELFGDNTLLADGTKAKNGFEALAQYDSNGDGIIDKNDDVFDSLRIWVDSDGNGISSEGELKSLSELGIIGIRLDYTELNGETGTEAILGNGASFIREDGTESAAAELWVSSDLYDTTETIDVEISEEIAKLPDVRCIGNAYSLHTALALDETGTLKGYVETFINSKSSAEKWQAVDNILYFICGAENIDSESKGGIIDAKQLAVLETMLGEKFVGLNGENPNAAAAPILEEAYRNIAEMYYSSLCIQTSIKDYAALLRCTENEDGTKTLNADLLNMVMDYELANGCKEFDQKLYDLAIYVKQLDNCGINGLNAFIIHYAGISYDYAEMMTEIISNGYKANGISNLIGTTNADLLLGSESSEMIIGGAGNDIIIGGKGDDTLYGGAGDDTYIFNIGDGNDIINEQGQNSSNDTVRFGEGITLDDITISRSISDMVISYSENDSVTLSNVYSNSKYWVNNIEFADGTRLSIEDLFDRSLTISGSGKITDFTSGFGNRDSTIIGSETADQIYGFDGNDIIMGGKGDDILYGGAGDDTYIFNIGDGNDIINEQGYGSSNDTVRFGEGITLDDITISRRINDMVISYSENDSVTLSNVYSNSKYWVNNIEFADGTRLSIEDLFDRSLTISGSGKITDFTSGFGNRDSTIIGSETADQIYGFDGNDIIMGGKGDDILYGGAGDDTYIFNIGDGNDIISEQGQNSSNDTVRFGEGITLDDITISRRINDMVISYSENDSVTLSNVYSNSIYWVNNIEFADGTRLSIEDLFDRSLTISGSGKITDFTSGFGNRDSTIIGSETADQIYGFDGNDIIMGGKGDDILYGGAGDDTYIFNIGDGNDIINEQGYGSSNDTVLFGEEISVNDIQFSKSGNDLAISFAGSDDLLTIISQFSNSKYAVENFTTSDGYSISSNQIDLLIQAMASFEADSGMTWNEAVENNDKRAADIINEMWIKTA